jgi:hypothetical protein
MVVTSVLLACLISQDSTGNVYVNQRLGIQFEYPKTWKVRKNKLASQFTIPVEGGTASAQVFNAKFKGKADEWQEVQIQINTSLKRTVERQWQEDYLGVPMLMTKISFIENGKGFVGFIGLLYSTYEEKLNFRLTVPTANADEAEAAWKQAMLTLRTVSGELPEVEDPSKPSVKTVPDKATTVWTTNNKPAKPVRGEVALAFNAGNSAYKLSAPKGWTLNGQKLAREGLSGALAVEISTGPPEDAANTLLMGVAATKDQFSAVTLREDPPTLAAPSGAIVGRVFRVGKGSSGPLSTANYVGYCEGIYWSLSYSSTNVQAFKKDKQILEDLARVLYVEVP